VSQAINGSRLCQRRAINGCHVCQANYHQVASACSVDHWTVRCAMGPTAGNGRLRQVRKEIAIVHCLVCRRTKGNQGLPSEGQTSPLALGAIKGPFLDAWSCHPSILRAHRNYDSTQPRFLLILERIECFLGRNSVVLILVFSPLLVCVVLLLLYSCVCFHCLLTLVL
jgi:hypothetical protein